MYQLTYGEAAFSILLWLFLFLKYRSATEINYQGKGNYTFFLVGIIIFSTFGFISGSDFFTYYENFDETFVGDDLGYEHFYTFIFNIVPHNYFYCLT